MPLIQSEQPTEEGAKGADQKNSTSGSSPRRRCFNLSRRSRRGILRLLYGLANVHLLLWPVEHANAAQTWGFLKAWPAPLPVAASAPTFPTLFSTNASLGLPIGPFPNASVSFAVNQNWNLTGALCFTLYPATNSCVPAPEGGPCVGLYPQQAFPGFGFPKFEVRENSPSRSRSRQFRVVTPPTEGVERVATSSQ